MHVIIAAEGPKRAHELIYEFFDKLTYPMADGTNTKPCIREIRFYDIVIDESVSEKFYHEIGSRFKFDMLSGRNLKSIASFFSRFLPFDMVDMDKYKGRKGANTAERRWRESYPKVYPPYIYVLGSLPDKKNDEGVDLK